MKVLSLDLSCGLRSVALLEWDGIAVQAAAERTDRNFRQKTAMAMVDELIQEVGWKPREIEAVTVGLGPGSYTGIRISLALAQGWQFSMDCKVAGASSSEAIAMGAQTLGLNGEIEVLIDAQRNELYVENYHCGEKLVRTGELRIVPNEQWRMSRRGTAVGPDLQKWAPPAVEIYPAAMHIASLALRMGNFLPAEELQPIYLRETAFVKAALPREV